MLCISDKKQLDPTLVHFSLVLLTQLELWVGGNYHLYYWAEAGVNPGQTANPSTGLTQTGNKHP